MTSSTSPGSQLRGLAAHDLVEHAGYPLATGNQFVRVIRDGRTVAAVEYAPRMARAAG